MTVTYILPGFTGSQLSMVDGGTTIWAKTARLWSGAFKYLAFHGTPAIPDDDNVRQMKADGVVYDYLDPLFKAINGGTGSVVRTWWYDWRDDIYANGLRLAESIQIDARPSNPCNIVGHSMGGLVARAAWMYLKKNHKENLVRRIITLGAPHKGCFGPAAVFRGIDELARQIGTKSIGFELVKISYNGNSFTIPLRVIRIAGTWPGLYQMLPLLKGRSEDDARYVSSLFDEVQYPSDLMLKPTLFQSALDWQEKVLNDPDSRPPYSVITCVAGTGTETMNGMKDYLYGSRNDWYTTTASGDGTVTTGAAFTPESKDIVLKSTHQGLVQHQKVLDNIAAWIDEERTNPPDPPPPPPAVSTVPPPPSLGGNMSIVTIPALPAARLNSTPALNVFIDRDAVKPGIPTTSPSPGTIDVDDPKKAKAKHTTYKPRRTR